MKLKCTKEAQKALFRFFIGLDSAIARPLKPSQARRSIARHQVSKSFKGLHSFFSVIMNPPLKEMLPNDPKFQNLDPWWRFRGMQEWLRDQRPWVHILHPPNVLIGTCSTYFDSLNKPCHQRNTQDMLRMKCYQMADNIQFMLMFTWAMVARRFSDMLRTRRPQDPIP